MRRLAAALLIAGAGFAASGALAQPIQPVPPDAIALVAGEPVLRADFDQLLAQARCAYGRQKRAFPTVGTPEYEQLKDQAVAFLVQRVIYRQKATGLGIVVTDGDVEERLRLIKQQYFEGDEQRYQEELRRLCMTEATIRRDIAGQLVVELLYERLTAGVTVSEAEVEHYYRTHRSRFRAPASRTVQHILVRTRTRANRLYDQILAGASFSRLARKHSIDQGSRREGGRLTISKGQTVRAFDRVAFALRTGAVSRPVRTRFGWHLIKALSSIRPAHQIPLSKVRAQIRQQLLMERHAQVMAAWMEAVRAEYADKVVYAPGFEPRRP